MAVILQGFSYPLIESQVFQWMIGQNLLYDTVELVHRLSIYVYCMINNATLYYPGERWQVV